MYHFRFFWNILLFLLLLFVRDRVCLCSFSYSGTRSVHQAGFELRPLPPSAKIKGVTTTAGSFIFVCFSLLHTAMSVHHMHALSAAARRGHCILRDLSYRGCKLPNGYWEWNPGPMEEETVLLTAEPSFHLTPTSWFWLVKSLFLMQFSGISQWKRKCMRNGKAKFTVKYGEIPIL